MSSIVLDPRMSYSVLKDKFENDLDLSSHLEISKDDLHKHYKENYAPSTPLSQPSQPSIPVTSASLQKNFIARLNHMVWISTDELLEFWSLPQEDFERCDPLLHWWYIPGVLSLLYYEVFNLTYFFFKKKGLLLRERSNIRYRSVISWNYLIFPFFLMYLWLSTKAFIYLITIYLQCSRDIYNTLIG